MYPYLNEPPRDETNPPAPYSPPVPPYQYQNNPGYYPPSPPADPIYPIMRVIGVVGIIIFLVALLGAHHFFFWPIFFLWPFFFAGRRRYRRRYRYPRYDINAPYHYGARYDVPPPNYNYPTAPQNQPGNYYPSQWPQPYNQPPTYSWPAPPQAPTEDNNGQES